MSPFSIISTVLNFEFPLTNIHPAFHNYPANAKPNFQVGKTYREESKPARRVNVVNHGVVDTSNAGTRLTDCLAVIEERHKGIRVGDRVEVSCKRTSI